MWLAICLLAYAAVCGYGAEALLMRCGRYLHRTPRIALCLWHATAVGVLLSAIVAASLLAHDVWEHSLAWLLHADKALLHDVYAAPGEVDEAWNGAIALTVVLIVALLYLAGRSAVDVRRRGHAHQLLATHQVRLNTTTLGLIASTTPAVYCVAGRNTVAKILVTTGALNKLSPEHLKAALEHEQAHLRGHHHAMTVFADAVARITQRLGLLRHYPAAIRQLIEMAADDHAASRCGRHTVASALLEMCNVSQAGSELSLGYTGADPATRIRRLVASTQQRNPRVRACLLLTAVSLAITPVVAAIGPAARLTGSAHEAQAPSPSRPAGVPSKFQHHE